MGRSNIRKMSKDFVKILLFYVGWTCYILPAWQFESNSNESSSTDFFQKSSGYHGLQHYGCRQSGFADSAEERDGGEAGVSP